MNSIPSGNNDSKSATNNGIPLSSDGTTLTTSASSLPIDPSLQQQQPRGGDEDQEMSTTDSIDTQLTTETSSVPSSTATTTGATTTATTTIPTSPTNTTSSTQQPDQIQSILNRLLLLRGSPPGTLASISETEIKFICTRVRPILLSQPMLLELEAPLKICGDVHGQYTDLLRLFEYGGFPPEANYLFLGDYVDRGKQSLEVICLLLCYKILYPTNFFLLRGNHEAAGINRIYGFYDECKRRYSIKLWKVFSDVFNCLPVSALVDEKILCMHGGLSPEISSLQQIADLSRPSDVPDVGLMCDLLWSDPDTTVSVSSFYHYIIMEKNLCCISLIC